MTAIRVASPSLTFRAGSQAYAHIRERGLSPSDVHLIPGAAGGPKALGIQGLDLALFGEWLPRARQPRALMGASIGSWRFAAACLPDPAEGIRRLGELYTVQRFPRGISSCGISDRCGHLLDDLLAGNIDRVLDNPLYHLNVVTVRCRGLLRHDARSLLGLGLGGVASANLIGRKHLKTFFERTILHDQRCPSPLDTLIFPTRHAVLTADNLRPALLASASIPLLMEGVRNIPGCLPGVYRDGGLLDYHLDLPYRVPGVVLYPHFFDRIVPGWFDKILPWRRGNQNQLKDVLVVAPSSEYLASLPYGKLPNRSDFSRFVDDHAAREAYWRKAMDASRRLGDEFLELADSGRLADRLAPL